MKKNKRKERGSTASAQSSSSKSPSSKKHRQHHHHGGANESEDTVSDSESSGSDSEEDSIRDLVRDLVKSLKSQKKMLQGIHKKQDEITNVVKDLDVKVDRMGIELAEQGKSIDFVHKEVKELRDNQKQSSDSQRRMVTRMDEQQALVNDLMDHVNRMERKTREKNLRIVGYAEAGGVEDTASIVKTVLREKFKMEDAAVETAHRVGNSKMVAGRRQPRHIVFQLTNLADKHQILKNKRAALEGADYYITDDMIKADMDRKRELQPVIDDAVRQHKKWKFRNGQLFINDRIYRTDRRGGFHEPDGAAHQQQQQQRPGEQRGDERDAAGEGQTT